MIIKNDQFLISGRLRAYQFLITGGYRAYGFSLLDYDKESKTHDPTTILLNSDTDFECVIKNHAIKD